MKGTTSFGKYELVSLLSVGGMAEIHLACIVGPGGFRKFVVVKRILPDLQDDPLFADMFINEARLTAALSHANIAQVFEFGQIDGTLFLSMELVHGIDLVKAIRRSAHKGVKVPLGLALKVVYDLCLALNYAHTFVDAQGVARPVIHRDVTPRNVMLSHSGTLKVIDFGIAKQAGGVSHTAVGSVKGSADYMAPEQIVGEPLDGRSDLFSAGVILHELLTGRRLFEHKDPMEAMRRAVTTPAPSPSTLAPDVPEVVSEVTLKALERDASKRFATGREMAQAIEAAARGKMYDEFMVGAWVREQFPEQLERTRKLMESLSAREEELQAAASSLAGDGEAPTGRSRSLAPAPATGEAMTMELDASRGATILVVDDSSLGRKLVTLRLEAEGFRIVAATSAEEALEYLSEMRPDLVITDVRMGELDGFGLCERIRQREELQLLPVIFLSASCSAEERAKGLAVGGDDFIRKPFEPLDLVTRVRSHLRRVAVLRRPKGR